MSDRPPDSVASITSTIPRVQLWHKELKPEELLVLFAMLEIGDSTGQCLYPSIVRIADYTKLAKRTVQRVLHGEDRLGRAVYVGLVERRVLVEIAPANATKRRAATYRLQIEALRDSPRTERWRQKKLRFPVGDIDLEKWVHHNLGAWSEIKRELRMAAEARVGTPALSPAASAAFIVSIAREHGMPHRLATLCVEMSRK